jgi:hypothetical protein
MTRSHVVSLCFAVGAGAVVTFAGLAAREENGAASRGEVSSHAAQPSAARFAQAGGGGLKVGEYACYGGGGSILIGLGFKVLDGARYTDLDNKSPGTYRVTGDTVTFTGGHLDGQTGRGLRDGKFNVGAQASCAPW